MQYKFFGNPLKHFFVFVIITAGAGMVGGSLIWGPQSGILVLTALSVMLLGFLAWLNSENSLVYFRFMAQLSKNCKVVQLLDYQGRLQYTLALQQPNSHTLTAFVYYQTRVGPLVLHENGLVTEPNHRETYIMFWQPYNKQDLMIWLLKGPPCDFAKVQELSTSTDAYTYVITAYNNAEKPWLNHD